MSSVRFQTVTDAELGTLHAFAAELFREHFAPLLPEAQLDYMIERQFTPETVRREIAAGVRWEWLRGPDDGAFGFLSCGPRDGAAYPLRKVYLLAELRGLGLGRLMIERVLEHARRSGAATVRLAVNRRNEGPVATYRHLGFRVVAEVDVPIGGGFVMDDYVMELPLA